MHPSDYGVRCEPDTVTATAVASSLVERTPGQSRDRTSRSRPCSSDPDALAELPS